MKKMGWGFSLAVASMVFFAGQAMAQSSESTGNTGSTMPGDIQPSSKASGKSLHGKVENFDRTQNTLTLSGSSKTLKVDPNTKVMKNGSKATLDDIQEGDEVRASYSGSGTTLQVKSIDIMSTGSMGAPSTSTPSTAPPSNTPQENMPDPNKSSGMPNP
ncbi:MAG TPA: hypothetical protein VMK12_22125 [Anaeromyxobacteraceae bacterium]|nr:hypothetical protein [Anaeromyxobacteraceae bacterium]